MTIESLSLGQMLVLGFAGLVALLLATVRFRLALLLIGAMLFVSALGVPLDYSKNIIRQWVLPLQSQRSTLYLAAAALLVAASVVHAAKLSFSRVSIVGVLVFTIACYAGLMRLFAGHAEEGMQSMAFAALTIPVVLVALASLVNKWEDFYAPMRIICLVSMAWIGCVGLQFLIDWKKLVVQHGLSRFHGLLANPQHAAVFLSVAAVTALFLALNDPKMRYRLVWAAVAGVNVILILWTGSRTGLGMLGLGMMAVLYARAGRAVLFLPVVGLIAILAFNFLLSSRIEFDIEGLGSRGDNRSQAWRRLLEEIGQNPALGVGVPKDIPSENSYLFAMASYGVGMGLLIFILMLACGVQSLMLWQRKRWMPPGERRVAELVIGFYAMYFGGALFEGYIIARVSTQLMFILIFSALGARLLQMAREREREGLVDADWSASESAEDGWDEAAAAYEEGSPAPA